MNNPRLEVLGAGEYCFYSTDNVNGKQITRKIQNGAGYIYYCDGENAGGLRTLFTNIDGESIALQNINTARVFKILNYKRVSADTHGNIYGYSNRGRAYIRSGNKKINLQVSVRGDIVTVGWPVILGGY